MEKTPGIPQESLFPAGEPAPDSSGKKAPLTSTDLASLETGGLSVTEMKGVVAGQERPDGLPVPETVVVPIRTAAERDALDQIEIAKQQIRLAGMPTRPTSEVPQDEQLRIAREFRARHAQRSTDQLLDPGN